MVIEIPAVKRILGSLMSAIWPGLTMGNGLDAGKVSHDPKVVSAYETDPRVHDRVSARLFTELLAAMETVHAQTSGLTLPILLQVAGDDHLVSARSSLKFYKVLNLDDKTLHVYDGLYHEIYNEAKDQRRRVLKDLDTWLEKHIIPKS